MLSLGPSSRRRCGSLLRTLLSALRPASLHSQRQTPPARRRDAAALLALRCPLLAPWLNDLEHDWRYPPENAMIERLARILEIPADMPYFYAGRLPPQVDGILDDGAIEARTERMNSGNVRRRLDANGARDPRVEISADPEPRPVRTV
jgi:hypothetical protein